MFPRYGAFQVLRRGRWALACPWMALAMGAGAATVDVEVGDFSFEPATIDIQVGDTVRWSWVNGQPHTVTSGSSCTPDRLFDSGARSVGATSTFTFTRPGRFPYFCRLHCAEGMVGAVNVAEETPPPSSDKLTDPIPQAIQIGGVVVALIPIATGLTAPNWGAFAPGDTTRLFVVDQVGTLWSIDLGTGEKSVFGDLSGLLVPLGIAGPGTYDERGFLGLAFHPDYGSNGLLYTFTTEPAENPADFSTLPSGTDADSQSVVREWQVPDPSDPASVIDPDSSRVLLRIDKPQSNHNGGALNFGQDGLLYISTGDGGGADDQGVGHGARGNGQNRGNVLGKILRINPTQRTAANGRYGIPRKNPFVPTGAGAMGGQNGCTDGRCDEIYAYGFRNPFRFSFDSATGALYAADVGQNSIEEIDVVKAGGNYGWRIREGSFCFDANGEGGGFVAARSCGSRNLINPVAQYDHDEGRAIVGGFVYRGSAIPALRGRYVFGDYARTLNNDGRLFFLARKNLVRGNVTRKSKPLELRFIGGTRLGLSVLGFGQDAAGELYVLGNTTGVPSGSTGVVLKIVP
jgi:plastocyanin/glucose/arabinose dehydrogenase